MKLEFLDNINNNGQYDVERNRLIRLYDFDHSEALMLRSAIKNLTDCGNMPPFSELGFVECINCDLKFLVKDSGKGITEINASLCTCELSIEDYKDMFHLITPFCNNDMNGYQWLCNTVSDIDLLLSPGGTW